MNNGAIVVAILTLLLPSTMLVLLYTQYRQYEDACRLAIMFIWQVVSSVLWASYWWRQSYEEDSISGMAVHLLVLTIFGWVTFGCLVTFTWDVSAESPMTGWMVANGMIVTLCLFNVLGSVLVWIQTSHWSFFMAGALGAWSNAMLFRWLSKLPDRNAAVVRIRTTHSGSGQMAIDLPSPPIVMNRDRLRI